MVKRSKFDEVILEPLAGFTLVEMMVTLAVFSLLLFILFQALSASIAITQFNVRRMTASDEARIVFDRMDSDWENRLHYGTSQLGVSKTATNDEVWWSSYVPANVSGRGFASCDYKIAVDSLTSKLALQRGVEAYDWASASAQTLPGTNLFLTNSPLQPASSDFQTLSPGVLRLAVTPVTNNGVAARANATGTPAIGQTNYVGFFVTIVSVDQTTLAKLNSAAVVSLSSSFTNATSTNSVYQAWQNILNGNSLSPLARGNLLVSERYYNWDQ